MPRLKIGPLALQGGELFVIVDGGETFEGTLKQWADCFFSNPTVAEIKDFCKKNGSTVRFEWRKKACLPG